MTLLFINTVLLLSGALVWSVKNPLNFVIKLVLLAVGLANLITALHQ